MLVRPVRSEPKVRQPNVENARFARLAARALLGSDFKRAFLLLFLLVHCLRVTRGLI